MGDSDKDDARKLMELGAEIVGGASGAAAGFLVAGPVGALGGATVTPMLIACFKRLGHEVLTRLHSKREAVRAGAAMAIAAKSIEQRLRDGDLPRSDDFFSDSETDRSAAEELLEGVILAAQRDSQERKVPYYGHLYANLAFDPTVSRAHANYLIRLLDRLSYRQLCLLAELGSIDSMTRTQDQAQGDLINELNELATLGLIEMKPIDNFKYLSAAYTKKPYGHRVYELCGLASIDEEARDVAFGRHRAEHDA